MKPSEWTPKHRQRFRDFLSGLIAGVISVTVCNPLDIARTRLNVMSSPNHKIRYNDFTHAMQMIWKQEGLKGFYAGYKINLKAIPLFHSLFFPIYEGTKQWCRQRNYPKWKQYLISTLLAGGFCNFATNPIWVVRTRIMVQFLHHENKHYKTDSIIQIMRQMVQQQGVKSLFKGLSASLLGVSNAIIYFYIYETMKQRVVQQGHKKFTTYYVFIASMISKCIASTITYPFIVIRTILHDDRTESQMTFRQIFKHIYQQKGISGFYAGLRPDLYRLLPSNTIIFIVYEYMKRKLPV